MSKLRVRFDNPEYGWIGISVEDASTHIFIDAASHYHSFYELVTALIALTDEQGTFSVTWLEEPVKTEWRFTKIQDNVTFVAYRSLAAESIFRFSGSYRQACFPFWRALQSLKGRYTKQELEERIQDGFPFSELERLTALIEQVKAQE